jgi:hypothetical protein
VQSFLKEFRRIAIGYDRNANSSSPPYASLQPRYESRPYWANLNSRSRVSNDVFVVVTPRSFGGPDQKLKFVSPCKISHQRFRLSSYF